MEKRKPSHDLIAVKAVLGDPRSLALTTTALSDATALGYDRSGVAAVMQTLTRRMFFKSMTTFADHTLWQDVYHVPVDGEESMVLYVKFQADVVTTFRLMSFKEK